MRSWREDPEKEVHRINLYLYVYAYKYKYVYAYLHVYMNHYLYIYIHGYKYINKYINKQISNNIYIGISPVAIPAHATATNLKNINSSQSNKKNKNIVTSIDKNVDFGLESNAGKSDKRCSICLTQVFISFDIRRFIFFTYALFAFFV